MSDAPDTAAGAEGGTPSEVFFYHMTRSPLEATLPVLLEKSLQAGWRVCLRGRDQVGLQRLDELLWTQKDDSFLPHGVSGGPHDADQPILLTCDMGIANRAEALISIDGAEIRPQDLAGKARVSVLFDGNDAGAVAHARSQWKAVTAAGCTAKYWSQENGAWQMKASS